MALGFTLHQPGYYPSFFEPFLTRNVDTSYVVTTIYPTFYKQIVVEYSIPPHWGNCLFNIYRSESDVGPWTKINPTPVSGNYFKDTTTMDFSKFMQGWYIVEVQLPDGQLIQGLPVTWQNKRLNWVELRAKEIERRETLLLEKFVGVKTMVFRRRNFGQRCSECWDPQTEKLIKDHCKTCLGTSFTGGYFPGYPTLFQYDQNPNDLKLGDQGVIEANQITAWTISTPLVEVRDVILRIPDLRVYRVEHTQSTELQTVGVRQTVVLSELGPGNVEFELAKQAMPVEYSQ